MNTRAPRWTGARSPARLGCAALLLFVYAAPILVPPEPARSLLAPNAPFLERIFEGVPPAWVIVRLAALCAGALLLSGAPIAGAARAARPFHSRSEPVGCAAPWAFRLLALAVALGHAAAAAWAGSLGPSGQTVYLLALGLPALLLAVAERRRGRGPIRLHGRRIAVAVGVVIIVWLACRLLADVHSPRTASIVDAWRIFIDLVRFASEPMNLLTDPLDPDCCLDLPATPMFFQGLPLFRSGVLAVSFGAMQVLLILWLAASAVAVGYLATTLAGGRGAVIAVAVFLFASQTRFFCLNAMPWFVGVLYAPAVALCALRACRRRSEAALAGLGALAGAAISWPTVVPTLALFGAATAWHLRRQWRRMWVGGVAAVASFTAAVVPTPPYAFTAGAVAEHVRLQGRWTLIQDVAMGQRPIGTVAEAVATIVRRPGDIVAGAALAPFTNVRTPIRLWGDTLFDPVGEVLLAIGLAACVRCARRSARARLLLLFFAAALFPACLSNTDRPNLTRALVLPVPVALLAAVGFGIVRRQLCWPAARRWAAAAAATAICVGGTVVFDVVNPRILTESSMTVLFRSLRPEAADRAIVLNYPKAFSTDVSWLFVGPMTAFAGPRPVGYLEYAGGALPDLAGGGQDLVFWSPAVERDLRVTEAVCAQWSDATLYEIWDPARRGRVLAARVGGPAWEPAGARARWQRRDCAGRGDRPEPRREELR